MKKEEAIAYRESLKNMTKGELIKNSMSLKRRLDKLSGICDVEGNRLSEDREHRVFEVIKGGKCDD